MLRALLKEPLVHFLGLGLLVFAVYYVLDRPDQPQQNEIVVSAARIEQFAGLFEKAWNRPPSAQELDGLINDYVKEEVLYREAVALSLDKDDTIVRRRMRQKMEFLGDIAIGTLSPTDQELEAYLEANPRKFEREPKVAFEQIYLDPARRGERIDEDAGSILEALRSDPGADPAALGDATLLPGKLGLTGLSKIAQSFGPDFARKTAELEPGVWSDPIESAFGQHLVKVDAREPGRIPELSEAREAVKREWLAQQRKELEDKQFAQLLKRYQVSIEREPGPVSQKQAP